MLDGPALTLEAWELTAPGAWPSQAPQSELSNSASQCRRGGMKQAYRRRYNPRRFCSEARVTKRYSNVFEFKRQLYFSLREIPFGAY